MKNYLNKKTAIASLLVLALIAASAFTYAWFIVEDDTEIPDINVGIMQAKLHTNIDEINAVLQPDEPDMGYEVLGEVTNEGTIEFIAKLMSTKPTLTIFRNDQGKLLDTPVIITDDDKLTSKLNESYVGFDSWLSSGNESKLTGKPFTDVPEFVMWYKDTKTVGGMTTTDYYIAIDAIASDRFAQFAVDFNLDKSAGIKYMGAKVAFGKENFKYSQIRDGAIYDAFGVNFADLEGQFDPIAWWPSRPTDNVDPAPGSGMQPRGKSGPAFTAQEVYDHFMALATGE